MLMQLNTQTEQIKALANLNKICMEIQSFILEHYEVLLLIIGLIFLFSGIAPIVSKNYYTKNYDTKWNHMFWPFSRNDGYIYDRYIRQMEPILIGGCFVAFAIYKLLFAPGPLNMSFSHDALYESLKYTLNYYSLFILLIGIFLVCVGISPNLPDKYSKNIIKKVWSRESWPFTETDHSNKNRYKKQSLFVLLGMLLAAVAVYNM